jgi:hypothetical protein
MNKTQNPDSCRVAKLMIRKQISEMKYNLGFGGCFLEFYRDGLPKI